MNNKYYLLSLVSLIFLSMFGLVAVQVFWIINSYQSEEQLVNYQINKSLSSVIKDIETHETIFEISNEVFQIAEKKDSIVHRSINNFRNSIINSKNDVNTIGNRSSILTSGKQILETEDTFFILRYHHDDSQNKETVPDMGEVKHIIQNKINDKSLFVEKIVNKLINYNENALERLKNIDLHSIIEKSLKENGLPIEFEYAIRKNDKIIFSTLGFNKNSKEIYSKKLSPLFYANEYLDLYITNRASLIVESMLPIIVIALILTIFIISIVIFIFLVIVKQKKLSDIKNDFVNNLTHELKTPIATISLAGQMLSDKDVSASKTSVLKYAKIISEESKRLTKQVEKVLQIALIDKKQLALNNKPINLNILIEKLAQPFKLRFENSNGNLVLDLGTSPKWIFADELHISNIINNLIDNALKYKNGAPTVIISLRTINEKIHIVVKDNGIGISKPDQSRVFNRFYRVTSGDVHNIKGSGLGLSYVKKIVDIYNGEIELSSKTMQGSTFTIILNKYNN